MKLLEKDMGENLDLELSKLLSYIVQAVLAITIKQEK